jgi:hypothetical protein
MRLLGCCCARSWPTSSGCDRRYRPLSGNSSGGPARLRQLRTAVEAGFWHRRPSRFFIPIFAALARGVSARRLKTRRFRRTRAADGNNIGKNMVGVLPQIELCKRRWQRSIERFRFSKNRRYIGACVNLQHCRIGFHNLFWATRAISKSAAKNDRNRRAANTLLRSGTNELLWNLQASLDFSRRSRVICDSEVHWQSSGARQMASSCGELTALTRQLGGHRIAVWPFFASIS